MVIVLMGVSGCGKTTVGRLLAAALAWSYEDADDYHPPENVARMAAGVALTDDERLPWLRLLAGRITGWLAEGRPTVLGCSALRRRYRDVLVGDRPDVRLVYLRGAPGLIARRLEGRAHRYMPSSLLQSQFDALEEPGPEAIAVDIDSPPESLVARIRAALEV